MATNRTDQDRVDPSEQIPEADLLEQRAPLDPTLTNDDLGPVDRVGDAASAEPVDEADRWEQQLSVPPDEEYPRDDPYAEFEAGWS